MFVAAPPAVLEENLHPRDETVLMILLAIDREMVDTPTCNSGFKASNIIFSGDCNSQLSPKLSPKSN